MSDTPGENISGSAYALDLANKSYDWYRYAAIRSRRYFRLSETILLLTAASIPVMAALRPGDARIPAVMGAIVVILTGLRSLFHWPEDYLRFSQAREAVEAERRRYHTGAAPYDESAKRDMVLAANITRIEQQEMSAWVQIATAPSDTRERRHESL